MMNTAWSGPGCFRVIVLFLTFACCYGQENNATLLDLYAHSIHQQLLDPTAACDTCDSESCFSSLRYFVENDCLRTPNEASTKFHTNGSLVCRDVYADGVCNGARNATNCFESWTSNQCQDGFDEMTSFPDWCIREDAPRDDYVVPMIFVSAYPNGVFCQGDLEAQDYLIPNDPLFCQAVGVTINQNSTAKGGRITYCDGDTLRFHYFADEGCTETAQGLQSNSEHFNECFEQSNGFFTKAYCSSPSIYCKNLYGSDLGVQLSSENAPAPSPPASKPALDLYVQEFHLWQDSNTSLVQQCSTCNADDNCLRHRNYFVEGECLRSSTAGQSRIFQGDLTAICQLNFADEYCKDLITMCSPIFPADRCEAGVGMSRFDEWCIEESEPRDDYVVPLVFSTFFDDLDSCQTNTNGTDGLKFADPNFCQRGMVSVSGTRQHGSAIVQCDGDDLQIQLFSDQYCTEQADALEPAPLVELGADCTTQPDGSVWKAQCNTPAFHCKYLYAAGFIGFELGNSQAPPPVGAPTMLTASPVDSAVSKTVTNPPAIEEGGEPTPFSVTNSGVFKGSKLITLLLLALMSSTVVFF